MNRKYIMPEMEKMFNLFSDFADKADESIKNIKEAEKVISEAKEQLKKPIFTCSCGKPETSYDIHEEKSYCDECLLKEQYKDEAIEQEINYLLDK